MFRDTNANGAREDLTANRVSECNKNCRCDSDCVAFDFDTVNDKCWIHTNERNVEPDRRNDSPGVDLYIRKPKGEKQQCFEHVGVPQSHCATMRNLLSTDGCSTDNFIIFEDTNANGAIEDTAAGTVSRCRESCRCDSDCVGFDYDTVNDKCWIHKNKDNIEPRRRNPAPGVDLYVREPSGVNKFRFLSCCKWRGASS